MTERGPAMVMHIQFLIGVAVACSGAIALFFMRFWSRTRDRLFLLFALAFWLMAVGWVAQAFAMRYKVDHGPQTEFNVQETTPSDETSYLVYVPRLLAFGCIIWGIVDKNRANRPPRKVPGGDVATGP